VTGYSIFVRWCVVAPEEDHRAYGLGFEAGLLLMEGVAQSRGVALPAQVFVHMHADFHLASRMAVREVLIGTKLVNDVEHMYRNLQRNQSKRTRLQSRPISIVKGYLGFSASLPVGVLFSCFWALMFAHMINDWGEKDFVEYFKSTYFRQSSAGIIWATWWMGAYSLPRKSHPASQNLIESFHSRARRGLQATKEIRPLMAYLEVLERLFRRFCNTPGVEYSICGPGPERAFQLNRAHVSKSMIKGEGKRLTSGGVQLHFPTCEKLVEQYKASRGGSMPFVDREGSNTRCYVMHRLLQRGAPHVARQDATDLVAMVYARSADEVFEKWKGLGISGLPDNPEAQCINYDRIKYFFRDLTLVAIKRGEGPRCTCEVYIKMYMCPHICAVLHLRGDENYLETDLPTTSEGSFARKRQRSEPSNAYETQLDGKARADAKANAKPSGSTPAQRARLEESMRAGCGAQVRHSPPLPLHVPRSVIDLHKSIFADTDAMGVESMAFWFGSLETRTFTDLVVVDHTSGPTWVQTTGKGEVQLATFLHENPGKVCLAWVHSHHTLAGTPSLVDVENHWKLGRYYGVPAMAVVFQRSASEYADGLQAWDVKQNFLESLEASQGRLNANEDPGTALDCIELSFDDIDVRTWKLGKRLFASKTLDKPPTCPGRLAGDAVLCASHSWDQACMHQRPGAADDDSGVPISIPDEEGPIAASGSSAGAKNPGSSAARHTAAQESGRGSSRATSASSKAAQAPRPESDVSFQGHTEARLQQWLGQRMSEKGVQALKVDSWIDECPFAIVPGCLNFAEFIERVQKALLGLEKRKVVFLLKEKVRELRTWTVRLVDASAV